MLPKFVILLRSFLSHVVSWPGVYSKPPRAPLVWPPTLWKILYLCISHFPSPQGFSLLISMKYIKRKINVGDLLEDSRTCRRESPGNPTRGAADAESIKALTINCLVFLYVRSQGCNMHILIGPCAVWIIQNRVLYPLWKN